MRNLDILAVLLLMTSYTLYVNSTPGSIMGSFVAAGCGVACLILAKVRCFAEDLIKANKANSEQTQDDATNSTG